MAGVPSSTTTERIRAVRLRVSSPRGRRNPGNERTCHMPGGVGIPPQRPAAAGQPRVAETAPAAVEFRYTQTESFPALLTELRASLLVSTYQANKLLVARAAGVGLSTLVRSFDRPMGLAADARRLAVGTRDGVWFL